MQEESEPHNYEAKSKAQHAQRIKSAKSGESRVSQKESMNAEISGLSKAEQLRKSIEVDGNSALFETSSRKIGKFTSRSIS